MNFARFETRESEISVSYRDWYSKDVTSSFDRRKVYCRVLRPIDKKYKAGFNSIQTVDRESCFYFPDTGPYEGGFYFTQIENVINYFGWGLRLCYVTVPEGSRVYEQNPRNHFGDRVWRADKIFLSQPIDFTPELLSLLIYRGAIMNNYTINNVRSYVRNHEEKSDFFDILEDYYDKTKPGNDFTPNRNKYY